MGSKKHAELGRSLSSCAPLPCCGSELDLTLVLSYGWERSFLDAELAWAQEAGAGSCQRLGRGDIGCILEKSRQRSLPSAKRRDAE